MIQSHHGLPVCSSSHSTSINNSKAFVEALLEDWALHVDMHEGRHFLSEVPT